MVKNGKRKNLFFLCTIFPFFSVSSDIFTGIQTVGFGKLFCRNRNTDLYIKIHEAIASTATAPLLNLNLNYEKLRDKDTQLYLINKSNDTNLCIFKQ